MYKEFFHVSIYIQLHTYIHTYFKLNNLKRNVIYKYKINNFKVKSA